MPAPAGQRWTRRHDRRFDGPVATLSVPPVDHAETTIPDVTDRGHPRSQLVPERLGDDRVDLFRGVAGHPVERSNLAVRDKVGVRVDEPRQQGPLVIEERALIRDRESIVLDADDQSVLHQDGGAVVAERRPVKDVSCPDGPHKIRPRPIGARVATPHVSQPETHDRRRSPNLAMSGPLTSGPLTRRRPRRRLSPSVGQQGPL